MRTYILALTKYGIVAVMIAYTVLAFYLLFQKEAQRIRLLTLVENILILVFQFISYFTLYVALGESRYLLFAGLVMGAFFAIFLLYRTLYRHANMPLFNNMCLLLSVGLVIQSRLSFNNAVHQMMIASMGLVIAFVLPLLRGQLKFLKSTGLICGFVGIAILAVVMLLGATTLGANITYTIAGVTFQPSEFVKILFILFLAGTLKDVKDLKDLIIVTAFAAAHVLVLVGSKDLGSGLIFFVVFLFMAFIATGKWWILAAGFGAGGAGATVCYFLFSHIRERVQAFVDPWSLIDSIGYQITQSLFAIGAGGLFGVGLGQGTPSDVPFVESDFVFAAICEELGQLVGVCVILVGISCFMVMLELAAGFADRFYRLMAYGAAICYVFQMFLTLGGQTKFIPLTGVTLPFISYGGSSILSTLIIFTLVEVMCILRGEKLEELQRKRARETRSRERMDRLEDRRRYGRGESYPSGSSRRAGGRIGSPEPARRIEGGSRQALPMRRTEERLGTTERGRYTGDRMSSARRSREDSYSNYGDYRRTESVGGDRGRRTAYSSGARNESYSRGAQNRYTGRSELRYAAGENTRTGSRNMIRISDDEGFYDD